MDTTRIYIIVLLALLILFTTCIILKKNKLERYTNTNNINNTNNIDIIKENTLTCLTIGSGVMLNNDSLDWIAYNTCYIHLPSVYNLIDKDVKLFDVIGYNSGSSVSYPLKMVLLSVIYTYNNSSLYLFDLSSNEFKNIPVNIRPLGNTFKIPTEFQQMKLCFAKSTASEKDIIINACTKNSLFKRGVSSEWIEVYKTPNEIQRIDSFLNLGLNIIFQENDNLKAFDSSKNMIITDISAQNISQFVLVNKPGDENPTPTITVLTKDNKVIQLLLIYSTNLSKVKQIKDISPQGVIFKKLYGSYVDDKLFAEDDKDLYVYYDPSLNKTNTGWVKSFNIQSNTNIIKYPLYVSNSLATKSIRSLWSLDDKNIINRIFMSRVQDPSTNLTVLNCDNELDCENQYAAINFMNYFLKFSKEGVLFKINNFNIEYHSDIQTIDNSGCYYIQSKTPFDLEHFFEDFYITYIDSSTEEDEDCDFTVFFGSINTILPNICGYFDSSKCLYINNDNCKDISGMSVISCCNSPLIKMNVLNDQWTVKDFSMCLIVNHPVFEQYCEQSIRYCFTDCVTQGMTEKFLSFYKTLLTIQ